ncbi:MAG: helicase associated domain-containing protein [Clostridia bacterium]|nr:helicase associated domain-containing protein [Clostridia bacterium]
MSDLHRNFTESWNIQYVCAKQYFIDNGNLLVPGTYETDTGLKLGKWISHQRRAFIKGVLPKDRIELLEEIGMVWSVYDAQWLEYYGVAVEYYRENGNLFIPRQYITNDGLKLGLWIVTQRRQHSDGILTAERIELLEKIGMVWKVNDRQWQNNYDLAAEYYKKNGDLLVPQRYITTDNTPLGSWISHQRKNYQTGKLSEDRIELLEKIGMVWDQPSTIWEEMYKLAQQYYEENNNLSISNTSFVYKNASLGSWIVTQRKNYTLGRLTDKQITLLNKIGMEWVYTNNPDYVWEKNYNTVLEFYSKYKHLYIPVGYVTEDGVRLGVWLYDRKLEYKRNALSADRKMKLDRLDKTWLEPINTKSSFPEQAVLFYIKQAFPSATKLKSKEISEIDIYIPELKTGIEYDGPSHNNRVDDDIRKSRVCKDNGIQLIRLRAIGLPVLNDDSHKILLSDDSFESLNNGIIELLNYLMGNDNSISVSVKRDYIEIADNYIKTIDLDWYLMFEKLREYKAEHGNINVPIYYKTHDGILLGHWLSNIRSSYKNPTFGNTRLNSNKIKLLEELGIDWSPIESQWENMYLLAKQYYKDNGDLLIPADYVTEENIKLGRWIGTQRYNHKERILSEEKSSLLDKIGMVWSVDDYEWMKMYDLATAYYRNKGDLLVPDKYKTKDKTSLGAWIGRQRKLYRENKMPDKKIGLLNQIGMVWSLSDYEWMKMYNLAASYYTTNGNLYVPKDYKTSDNFYLGAWVERQRKLYQDNKLSKNEVIQLNKIAMEWSKTDNKWMKNYELAVSYYNDNGDLLIPSRYKTKEGINLGTWIKNQRKRSKTGTITTAEKELLNKIGMVWKLGEKET